jgi:uncharacterized protein
MASTEVLLSPAEASFAPGADEELSTPAPVKRADRISSLDILRGFALLGILVLNISDFAGPDFLHDIPVGLPKPAFTGPHAHLNLFALFLTWILFEGKMRGLFSMLFGAGVVLLTTRAEKRGAGIRGADIYTRRNMWLCALGLIHGTFLWDGDILFHYGLAALLCLFPLRVLKARTLLVLGLLIAVGLSTYQLSAYIGIWDSWRLHGKAAAAEAAQKAGQPISAEQKKDIQDWRDQVAKAAYTKAKTDEAVNKARAGYLANLKESGLGFGEKAIHSFYTFSISDSVGAMLVGMALFKSGFLSAELPYATYIWTAFAGLLLSVPIYIGGLWKASLTGFDRYAVEMWVYAPYALARMAGALAIAALLLIAIKSGLFQRLLRPFAAVGQTALSNYLLTTVLCQTLFLWGPWKLYGQLEYYQYYYVVFAVWAINLTLSSLWLRSYAFGPVEWLWRSLTYWRPQAMRLADSR